jgi:RHS repeat-associated protein
MAELFSHRFSTKYWDPETDLYYYGHRFYSPSLGRWVSRDPIGEMGGVNRFGYCRNSVIDLVDPVGLSWARPAEKTDCQVWAHFGHNNDVGVDGDEEWGEQQYLGYFVCFGDSVNEKIPKEHRIEGFPSIPGFWPICKDKRTPTAEEKARAARELSQAWCAVLKTVQKCCVAEKTEDEKGKPQKQNCCARCHLVTSFDKTPLIGGGTESKMMRNLQIIREYLAGADRNLASQIRNGCDGLHESIRGKAWGDGLPSVQNHPFTCRDVRQK